MLAARAGLVPGLPLMHRTFYIRLARVEEVAALSNLCFRSKAVWGYDPGVDGAYARRSRRPPLTTSLPAMCGIATGGPTVKSSGVVALAPGDEPGALDLNKLFVEPRHIRGGVCHALFAHALAEARRRGCRATDDPG
jgi:predicted N-acetyltransferase YhbS